MNEGRGLTRCASLRFRVRLDREKLGAGSTLEDVVYRLPNLFLHEPKVRACVVGVKLLAREISP